MKNISEHSDMTWLLHGGHRNEVAELSTEQFGSIAQRQRHHRGDRWGEAQLPRREIFDISDVTAERRNLENVGILQSIW